MTKQVNKFQDLEALANATPKEQGNMLAVWVIANKGAKIVPNGSVAPGNLPAYLRRGTGKRADINKCFDATITVADFLAVAKPLGGGYTDLAAALLGGYSRSANGFGKAGVVTLQA